MVRGETYYTKFQTNPPISLAGYSGTWNLSQNGTSIAGFSGSLSQSSDYFELTFQTGTLRLGTYRLECFAVFPDGFIQCFNDEVVTLS
jgi:hypothetical protein